MTSSLCRTPSFIGYAAFPVWNGPCDVQGAFESASDRRHLSNLYCRRLDDATLIGGPPVMLEGKIEDLRRSDAVIVDIDGAIEKLGKLRRYRRQTCSA